MLIITGIMNEIQMYNIESQIQFFYLKRQDVQLEIINSLVPCLYTPLDNNHFQDIVELFLYLCQREYGYDVKHIFNRELADEMLERNIDSGVLDLLWTCYFTTGDKYWTDIINAATRNQNTSVANKAVRTLKCIMKIDDKLKMQLRLQSQLSNFFGQ